MGAFLFRSWWRRLRGQLEPVPCPFSEAHTLVTPWRDLVASPARVLGAFGLRPGDRVLEIGPGIGYYSIEAARRAGDDGCLICLDLQFEMLNELRHRLEEAHVKAHLVCANATDIPLKSGSVDHVFLITVLGEIPNRPRALGEIHRVLRPRGFLSVSEQLPDPDFIARRTLRWELSAVGFREQTTRGHFVYTSTWIAIDDSDPQ